MEVLRPECERCLRVPGLVCRELKECCTTVQRMSEAADVDERCLQVPSPVSRVVALQHFHPSVLLSCKDELFLKTLPISNIYSTCKHRNIH